MKNCCWIIAMILLTPHAHGQGNAPGHAQGNAPGMFSPDNIKKKISATGILGGITIDGRLNEPAWQLAAPVPDFIQTDPVQGKIATRQTSVKILYDKEYLYVGVVCYDTVGRDRYRVLNFKRDFSAANSDFFAFAIDGYNDERNCMMFGMNPYAAQRDLLSFDDNYFDVDWDGLWIVRTQRTDTAWIAEAAVPWKTLRYKKTADSAQTWGISFGRIARGANEFSNWPAFPRAYGGLRMPYAAKLVNLHAPAPSTNIRIQPYLLYAHNSTATDGKNSASGNTIKPGGDLKWAINPNTLADATFNTDFAQADVDRKVNNINRFSVFYPERRQFFLENAGLFTVGIDPLASGLADYSARLQPFFSRAIGLDAGGSPLHIDAGARLVYRSDKRNFGGLLIRQAGNDSTNPAYFMTGRYSQNIGKQNRIGTLLSYKGSGGGSHAAGKQNFTGTIDGFFRFGQRLSWSAIGSLTDDLKGRHGYAAASQWLYNSNTVTAWWNQSVVSGGYDPQMGFVARGNVIITDPGFSLQERGKWLPKFIRSAGPGLAYTTYHNTATFQLTDRYINANPLLCQFQHGGSFYWYVVFAKQRLETSFAPLGVSIGSGTYSYTRHRVGINSDPSKKIAASLEAGLGQYYNGQYNALTATLSFAPIPHLFISPVIEIGKLKGVGMGSTTKNIHLYTIEGRVALNPRLQLSGLYQEYSTDHSSGWNARFSWEFTPLSYFYIVYNNNAVSQTVKTIDQQLITKVSYLRQL